MIDTRQTVLAILDAHAPPDVAQIRGEAQLAPQEVAQACRSLRQHLVLMPICSRHHASDRDDVIVWHTLMEQIAHRVNKDAAGLTPSKGLGEFFRHETEIETELIGMIRYAAKPFRKRLRITVRASRADLGAAPHRVPRGVRPLDR